MMGKEEGAREWQCRRAHDSEDQMRRGDVSLKARTAEGMSAATKARTDDFRMARVFCP